MSATQETASLRRKLCAWCVERFETPDRAQHYCSAACEAKAKPKSPKPACVLVPVPAVRRLGDVRHPHSIFYEVGDVVAPGGWVVLAVLHATRADRRDTKYLTVCPTCKGSRKARGGHHLRIAAACRSCVKKELPQRTHCPNSHELTPENTGHNSHRKQRECLTCKKARLERKRVTRAAKTKQKAKKL